MAFRYNSLTAIANSFRIAGGMQQLVGAMTILAGPFFVLVTYDNPPYLAGTLPAWPLVCAAGIVVGTILIVRGMLQAGYGEALLALADIAIGTTSNMPVEARSELAHERSMTMTFVQVGGFVCYCAVVVLFSVKVAPGRVKIDSSALETKDSAKAKDGDGEGKRCPAGAVLIPGGDYDTMKLRPYCLDRTEVTVDAYESCVALGKCTDAVSWAAAAPEATATSCNSKNPDSRGNHPINCVTWDQSAAFCAADKARLPSAEEWQWAARGGVRAWKQPWAEFGLLDEKHANVCGGECPANMKTKVGTTALATFPGDDGFPETAPVGSYPKGANRWGVLDMLGNVGEWTASRGTATAKDGTPERIWLGGSWSTHYTSKYDSLFIAAPESRAPSNAAINIGFRCARTPASSSSD